MVDHSLMKTTILLLVSDPIIRSVLEETLEREGYTVLATGDLGVRNAIRKAYQLEELPHPEQIEEMAVTWRPYCSVAMWYLWRSLEGPAKI